MSVRQNTAFFLCDRMPTPASADLSMVACAARRTRAETCTYTQRPLSMPAGPPAQPSACLSGNSSAYESAFRFIHHPYRSSNPTFLRSSLQCPMDLFFHRFFCFLAFLYNITCAYELASLSVHASMHRNACADLHEKLLARAQEHCATIRTRCSRDIWPDHAEDARKRFAQPT